MEILSDQVQTMLAFQRRMQRPILDILRPLFNSFSLTFFAHLRDFNDESKAFILSNAEVAEFWFRKQYAVNILLGPGCYFGERVDDAFSAEQQDDLKNYFNIAHPLFIVNKHPLHTDLFMLATHANNYHIIHSYLTYIEKIKSFLSYYLRASRKLINLAEKNKVHHSKTPSTYTTNYFIATNPLTDTASGRYFINEDVGLITLTRRELTCIAWLIKGKSASQIGLLLNISKRTVETYTENIKEKFKCTKLTELAYLIGKSNINFNYSDNSVVM